MKIATVMVSALLISSVQAGIFYRGRDADVKSGPAGGTGGEAFDDTENLRQFIIEMISVNVAHNKRIDGVGTVFTQELGGTGIPCNHGSLTGNDGRTVTEIAVGTDPIIKVNVRTDKGKVVGMDLVQRTGKVTVVGSTKGNPNLMEAPQPDMGLIGFHGRAGEEIDSLGVIWGTERKGPPDVNISVVN